MTEPQTLANTQTAIFAAGCFWGVQYYFDQEPGVVATEVGYTGGQLHEPSYEAVCSGTSGHAEAVKITFDPSKISYKTLLKHFFRLHDPTQIDGQGPDIGAQYRSAIFYLSDEQKQAATGVIRELTNNHAYDKPIVTEVMAAGEFWPAEEYHQKFTERTGRGVCHVPYQAIPEGVK